MNVKMINPTSIRKYPSLNSEILGTLDKDDNVPIKGFLGNMEKDVVVYGEMSDGTYFLAKLDTTIFCEVISEKQPEVPTAETEVEAVETIKEEVAEEKRPWRRNRW